MAEVTLGSLNLHMGRGTGGHDAPVYDVVAAAKEVDTDVLVLQEAWVPDDLDGHIVDIAAGLDYQVAATFPVARATCGESLALVGRTGTVGDGDWSIAVLSRLPILCADIVPIGPQLPGDPGQRALLDVTIDAADGHGRPFTVVGTHLPLLIWASWRLGPAVKAALPPTTTPAAFAGDMNMWGWCIDRMVPRGWRRAVRGRTYPAHRPHSQTDHILVTPAVEVVRSEVMAQVMSDHHPVRARLRLR